MTKEHLKQNASFEVPYSLYDTQKWFAGVLTHPLAENDTIQKMAPNGMAIAEEAARYILPGPKLRPHQRMEIYNQQYWWRLLKNLQESFPLLTRLFGYQGFNEEIGIPYLVKYPPDHWSLNYLGDKLPRWIDEEYHAPDRPLVHNAALLDGAFSSSFLIASKQPLNLKQLLEEQSSEALLSCTFYLQPHIYLFKWEYDLFSFREQFLKQDVNYWTDHDFPPLTKGKTYYFVLYRTSNYNLSWKEISLAEYLLLDCLKNGSNLNDACELLENQDNAVYEEAVAHLQNWFQEWTIRQWLTLEK